MCSMLGAKSNSNKSDCQVWTLLKLVSEPLTPDLQAKAVAERLKEFDIKHVYISPFYR